MIGYLMRKIFYKNLTSVLTEIVLTKDGFSVNEPFGAKPKKYDWNNIKRVQFSQDYKEVIIEISDKKAVLKDSNFGWYEFIQNVPSDYEDFDFVYVKAFMDSLKPCGVCGIIAVKENKCIVCETVAWNRNISENEVEYLKRKQLEFYSHEIKEGLEIKKVAEPEHGFKADKNWKPYI